MSKDYMERQSRDSSLVDASRQYRGPERQDRSVSAQEQLMANAQLFLPEEFKDKGETTHAKGTYDPATGRHVVAVGTTAEEYATFYSLAQRYNTTVENLKKWNPKYANGKLPAGTSLIVHPAFANTPEPVKPNPKPTPKPEPQPTPIPTVKPVVPASTEELKAQDYYQQYKNGDIDMVALGIHLRRLGATDPQGVIAVLDALYDAGGVLVQLDDNLASAMANKATPQQLLTLDLKVLERMEKALANTNSL